MNGVQTRLKCKPNVKRCKRFVFAAHSPLLHPNTLKTKAIIHFQTDHILTRFVFPPLNGNCNILMDGRSANAQLIRRENGKSYKVNTHYSSFNVEIVDSQAKYLRMRKKGEDEQNDRITSPMPGKVVKIPVTAGQEMRTGDTVIVIEAMKMQSNYKVTSDCRIKEILVQEGDNITGDQTLITLEPIV